MHMTRIKVPVLLIALLLLMVSIPTMVLAENTEVQEISILNTPIKGIIQVQKQGPVLIGLSCRENRLQWN